MDIFRVRLNCVDHYQATPTELDPQLKQGNDDQGQQGVVPRVPVIRVFGATETGQKVCAHIHGAFPYLYIEYKGSLEQAESTCLCTSPNIPDLSSRLLHLSSTPINRLCACNQLPAEHPARKARICCPHHGGQGHPILWVPCRLRSLFQDLHVQSTAHDTVSRPLATGRSDEEVYPTL